MWARSVPQYRGASSTLLQHHRVRHTVHIPHLEHPSAEARFFEKTAGLLSCPPHPTTTHRAQNTKRNHNKQMDVHFEDFKANQHTVEVGADDTAEHMRRKVASAMGLPEDSFCMSFRDEAMVEGYDMTQLSAGDTIVLTKSMKYEAVAALHALGETDLRPERLEEVEDPEVACLLLQAEVATVIPDGFLAETWLTRLDLSAVSFVTQIGDSFLEGCDSLTSVNLSGLSNVTWIGESFLYNCCALTTLDLTAFKKVTTIGECFLFGCNSLTTLDLTPFNNVTAIDSYFLHRCESLTTLDLTPLNNVTTICDYFLEGCEALTTLDLTPFNNVTEIGAYFLSGCSSLTTLDLSRLNKVKNVGSDFTVNCTSLTSIYLSGCSSAVSNKVRKMKKLSKLVVEERPKRSRDESPEQARKRQRHAQ